VNKAQLVEALSTRLGEDKKHIAATVDAFLDTVYRTVQKGEKVALTGFGVFEKRDRAARTARNPATGEKVRVKKTSVPAFRAGQEFKNVVNGSKKLPKVAPAKAAAKTTPTKTTTTRGTATKTAAAKAAAKKTTAKATPAKKTTAKATAAKTTAAKATAAKTTAAKTTAKAAPAKRTTAKATPARKTAAKSTPRKTAAKTTA
jgi:DNA-binding protein HU-beta